MTEEQTEHHIQDMTPALRQAAMFSALAAHLTRHPHLAEVNIRSTDLQLRISPTTSPAGEALVEWADTLTDPMVMVSRIKGHAFVYVTGAACPATVRVWTVVPGMLDALGWWGEDEDCALDLSQLRAIVAGHDHPGDETAHQPSA